MLSGGLERQERTICSCMLLSCIGARLSLCHQDQGASILLLLSQSHFSGRRLQLIACCFPPIFPGKRGTGSLIACALLQFACCPSGSVISALWVRIKSVSPSDDPC